MSELNSLVPNHKITDWLDEIAKLKKENEELQLTINTQKYKFKKLRELLNEDEEDKKC